jgi:putative sigma-54 modulation protein
MTDLPIHITVHHLNLSDSLRLIVRSKLAPVTRFANDAIAAEVVLRRRGGAQTRFSASARLALPGRDVHGHAADVNLYAAIGKLVGKLGRLLRKRKTRLAKTFKHPGRERIAQSPEKHWHSAKAFPGQLFSGQGKSEKRKPRYENYRLDRDSPRYSRLLPANTPSAG